MRLMRLLPLFASFSVLASASLLGTAAMAQQFAAPTVRIVDKIDETNLVTLKGNTHPAANAKNDQGRVSPDLPMTDLILVLSRDSAQQAAFDRFVASQYDADSPSFHHWLAPDEVGADFGPSESDVASVERWLTGHGFTIGEVTKDRLSIRFSGAAAQVESAFHTEIHNLSVKGAAHIGNMSDPQIPAAIAPVVVGVKALHNFFPRPLHRMGSKVALNREAGGWQRTSGVSVSPMHLGKGAPGPRKPGAQFTINVPATGGSTGSPAYTEEDVSPYDFATIYNVLPLWNKGIDGTGQTIAIAGTSDVSQNDVSTFRTFFGLPTNIAANTPQILHPNPALPGGDDPGICTDPGTEATPPPCTIDDLIENSLDVEWSGSIAKNAQLILVTAASQSATDDTLYDAESYIVNKVTAPVLSVSYGECELFMGTAGNAEYSTLWQTAASEGISVFVAAGDSGSASCDDSLNTGAPYVAEDGLSVSGLASTPYNTAVGGTDFNWCPPLTLFNSGTCSASPYWNSANSTTGASAVGYVPETPWNETCTNPILLPLLQALGSDIDGSNVTNTEQACNIIGNNLTGAGDLEGNYPYAVYLLNTTGGGGGASGCTSSDGSTVASCTGGYTKPGWQAGVTGIPGDAKRDLPDVSFFSADGTVSESAYLICVAENGGNCVYSADSEPIASEVGGTSASTPPMAAVMALINQKTGAPQGFANPELYKLAAQQTYSSCSAESVTTSSSCMFNDIDAGPVSGFAGNNAMPCDYGVGGDAISPNCTALSSIEGYPDTVGILTTGTKAGYTAGTGYDQATGLGSLNVANLVNAWTAVSGGKAVTVTVIPSLTTLSATQTLGVTGTVASSPAGGTAPTGTVTLTAGSYTSTATLSGGAYSFTITANSLAVGTDTINVSYGGDVTYSTGSGEAVVAVNGNGSTFSLTQPAIAVTPAGGVDPGASATAAVTVSSVLGYAGTVTLTCSELSSSSPTNSATDAPSCTGGGSNLAVTLPNATAQVISFTVSTTAPSTTTTTAVRKKLQSASNHGGWMGAGGGALLSVLLFLGIPARRRSWRAMLGVVMLLVALGGMVACGGGGSPATTTTTDPGTSAGTYVFTVTAVGNPSVTPAVTATFSVVVN